MKGFKILLITILIGWGSLPADAVLTAINIRGEFYLKRPKYF